MFCFRFHFRHAWLLFMQFMTNTVSRPFRVIWKRLRRPGTHFCWGICNYNNGDEYTHVMCSLSWWSHPMETFAALLAICAGNSPVPGEFPAQRPVTRNFDVFFDLRRSKCLSEQSWGWWFETPSRPLWRQYNDGCMPGDNISVVLQICSDNLNAILEYYTDNAGVRRYFDPPIYWPGGQYIVRYFDPGVNIS